MSEALHRAKLLQGQVVRLDARRKRQIEKANADYRFDLLALISHADQQILEIVQQACDHDRSSPELAADLRNAIWRRSNPRSIRLDMADQVLSEAEHEADTMPAPQSDDLPPPLPGRGETLDLEFEEVSSGGTARDPWGLGPETPRVNAPPSGP